jgi:hypothetical protein
LRRTALNTSLKVSGLSVLPPSSLLLLPEGFLQGPLVLQVVRAVNVSAPLERQSSGGAPRMLRLTLSDGSASVQALEVQAASQLPNAMPTGTKLYFPHARIPVSAWARAGLDCRAGQRKCSSVGLPQ